MCYFCCVTKLKTTWAKVHILADSRLADANKRRPEHIFEEIYRQLYGRYRDFQGCRHASQDWEEEGRDQGAYGHPCQRGSTFRHKVHVRGHQRLLFNNPKKDWENVLAEASEMPPELTLFD